MADTTFTQADLTAIEAVFKQAVLDPKEAVKGSIDLNNGGQLAYRSFDELLRARNNIKKIINSETNIDSADVVKSAYQPFSARAVNVGNL